jgi:hypothetical protein
VRRARASKSFMVALSMAPTLCNAHAEAWTGSNASLLNFRFFDMSRTHPNHLLLSAPEKGW